MLVAGMIGGRRRDLLAYATNRADPLPQEAADERPRMVIPESMPRTPEDDERWTYAMPESDPRYNIIVALHSGKIERALGMWREYAFENLDGVLPVREQLQIAQALDRSGALTLARDAYERLLAYYKDNQPYTAEAQLGLAGMLLQHAEETGERRDVPLAKKLLTTAGETHPQHARRELAKRWLEMA